MQNPSDPLSGLGRLRPRAGGRTGNDSRPSESEPNKISSSPNCDMWPNCDRRPGRWGRAGGRNELPGPTESDSGGGRGSNPRLQRRPCPQAAGPVAGRRLSLPRTESGPCGVLPVKEAARTIEAAAAAMAAQCRHGPAVTVTAVMPGSSLSR